MNGLRMTGSECALAITITHRADDDAFGFSATAVGEGRASTLTGRYFIFHTSTLLFLGQKKRFYGSND